MMASSAALEEMLSKVATALGELRNEMVFVGGCTTGLLITDQLSLEHVRHTDDVDLIVSVITMMDFRNLKQQLKQLGFREPGLRDQDAPTCAMYLDDLRVDFMPDNAEIIGFTNRWYSDAMQTASRTTLQSGTTISLINPVYFLATKLEAYKGRGNNDPLSSRDIEDILNLVDGREELLTEVRGSRDDVRRYIASEVVVLLNNNEFAYAVQSTANGDSGREEIIFNRLEALTE